METIPHASPADCHVNRPYTGRGVYEPEKDKLLPRPLLHKHMVHKHPAFVVNKDKFPAALFPEINLGRNLPARRADGYGMGCRNASPKLRREAFSPSVHPDFHIFNGFFQPFDGSRRIMVGAVSLISPAYHHGSASFGRNLI